MSELSTIGKIKWAMEIAKIARVGVTFTYFDVIELSGEIKLLEETIGIVDADIADLQARNAELVAFIERLIEAGNEMGHTHWWSGNSADKFDAAVNEWRSR